MLRSKHPSICSERTTPAPTCTAAQVAQLCSLAPPARAGGAGVSAFLAAVRQWTVVHREPDGKHDIVKLPTVAPEEADIVWFVYRLERDSNSQLFHLVRDNIVYTRFNQALDEITTPKAGDVDQFVELLQTKLEQGRQVYPPVNLTLFDSPREEVTAQHSAQAGSATRRCATETTAFDRIAGYGPAQEHKAEQLREE